MYYGQCVVKEVCTLVISPNMIIFEWYQLFDYAMSPWYLQ